MILLLWQDQYIFNTNPFSWVLGANIGRWCAWLHACSSNDESEHFDRSSLFVQKATKSRESGLLQTVERYLTERWQRILIFFINIYLEIFRFFFYIKLSKNPQGLPATYSDLDTIACVKSSLKKLTTKEKLWHASENGCMVCRDHKLTNGTRRYIAKSLRESPQREFLYKLMLRLSIPWCYITQQKDNTPAVMCIENGSFFSSLC